MAALESAGSVRAEAFGRVLVMTIDRPEVRNALDPPTLHALAETIDEATSDDAIGAAVLTGAGDRCFSSGMDLRSMRSSPELAGPAVRRFNASLHSDTRLPIVAAIRGMAIGGGFEIMLMCDLAVASDDARFGLPEVKRGLVPGGGGTLLPSRIPLGVALEMGLVGEPIDAPQALALGLVNRVISSDRVVDEAMELATRIADNPPATVARIRQLMWTTARDGPVISRTVARALPRTPELAREAADGVARFLSR